MNRMKHKVNFSGLITHRYAFSDLMSAFDRAIHDKEKALKVMLEI